MKNKLSKINTPWVESDLFNFLIKFKNKKYRDIAKKFNKDGYIIIDLKLSKKFIAETTSNISELASDQNTKKNPKIYHYNKNPRIIEGFKKFKNIKDLCRHKKITDVLKYLYNKKPIPFNSINFIKGTDQPLHSDYIHFSSMPQKFLAAAWIALERTDNRNGPLTVVPGSHKLDVVDYSLFNLDTPSSTTELSKYYNLYEEYIKEVVSSKKLKTKTIKLKPGQALIWSANLLHGGKKIIDQKRTRYSQVVHYHFDKCDFVYNPGFSDISKGKFAYRDLKALKI